MRVISLQFENFRNLKNGYIIPSEFSNVVYGNNAQGKTNLLEAVWLFSGGHSFRGSKESELIQFTQGFAKIGMRFFSQEREQKAEIRYSQGKKEVYINDVLKTSSALAEKFSAVVFSPEHLSLIKSGPSKRRRFIDGAIAQQKIKYAVTLSKFNKTLTQRNALLKDILRHSELRETLEIWNNTLAFLGANVMYERFEYCRKLTQTAQIFHSGISSGQEELVISYSPSIEVDFEFNSRDEFIHQMINKYQQVLKDSEAEDIRFGITSKGPHRDDIDIFINSISAKAFGSQGQQRSIVLSLKLAEAQILTDFIGENPVIILDDVLSELDFKRQDFLFNKINGYQVFISCCEKSDKEQLKQGKVFNVLNGEVE